MNTADIIYKFKTAGEEDIFNYLKQCDKEFSPPLSTRVNLEEYSHKLFEKSITFEAWINEMLVGMIAAYFNNTKEFNGYITNVSVEESVRGKHIANELLRQCIEYAKIKKFNKIFLEVNKDSIAAINLYEKFNFKKKDCKNEFIEMVLEI